MLRVMSEVIHRYVGKNGKPSKSKPSPRQEERDALSAKLNTAKLREREAIANIREMELARKRKELYPCKVFQRIVGWAFTVFKEHCRGGPSQLVRLVERTLRGKHALDDADKHALRMAIDALMREWLTELEANLCRLPAEFLKEEAT
jgi:hypothetical protein